MQREDRRTNKLKLAQPKSTSFSPRRTRRFRNAIPWQKVWHSEGREEGPVTGQQQSG